MKAEVKRVERGETAGADDNRVFVTGVTSQLGREVCRILLENGVSVVGLVRNAARADGLTPGMSLVEGACEDTQVYHDVLHSCRRVIHIAGMHLAPSIIRACAGHGGLQCIAFISSTRVHFPDRLLSPAELEGKRTLLEQEANVASTSLPWTILRPTLIHSAMDRSVSRFVARIEHGRIFPLPGSGNVVRQPISAADLAVSVTMALDATTTRQEIYDVPGQDITLIDMINTIQQLVGRKAKLVRVPRFAVAAVRALVSGDNRLAAAGTRYLRWYEDIARDGSDAARDFGHAPRDFSVNMQEQLALAGKARAGVKL